MAWPTPPPPSNETRRRRRRPKTKSVSKAGRAAINTRRIPVRAYSHRPTAETENSRRFHQKSYHITSIVVRTDKSCLWFSIKNTSWIPAKISTSTWKPWVSYTIENFFCTKHNDINGVKFFDRFDFIRFEFEKQCAINLDDTNVL